MSAKKGGKNTKDASKYEVGERVLAKLRGFPPWPALVVDPASVPSKVISEQPKKTSAYCVIFIPSGDFAWLQAKDLSLLKTHEIDAFLNDAKKGRADLVEGYKLAKESNAWYESYKKDQSARAEQEKESEDNAEVDQLESEGADEGDDEEEKSKSKTAKKRKRDSDADTIKPKKTAKPKKESNDAPKKKSATNSKSKKSKAVVESEDDAEGETTQAEKEDANGKSKASPPPAKKAKRDKDDDGDDGKAASDPQAIKVREWRHRLQKIFLASKAAHKAEDVKMADELFNVVEAYDGMTIEQLQFSKIGKVMRHIAAANGIPGDDEFKFRARAKELVDKWHHILNANKSTSSPSAQTNGKADKDAEAVTESTKNLDLNGKEATPEDAQGEVVAGDLSLLGDITMSEAA